MVSYLGAFPFGQDAPVVLGFEQMIMVVVIMTERYQRVLKKGNKDEVSKGLEIVRRGREQTLEKDYMRCNGANYFKTSKW